MPTIKAVVLVASTAVVALVSPYAIAKYNEAQNQKKLEKNSIYIAMQNPTIVG